MSQNITLVECPRDAMQGWKRHIPTEQKIDYLNALLRVGFDVLDFGSFVSPKAIPQLADTAQVLAGLDLSATATKLLAIVANSRGGAEAAAHAEISYLGFPFSISETFQLRNTNKTIAQSLVEVQQLQDLCLQKGKELVVYISMGFGNPYGDPYNADVALGWVEQLAAMGIGTIAMSDTVGMAKPDDITYIFRHLIPAFPAVRFGAHFHSTATSWQEKIDAAYDAGCTRFDSALKGIGGCPMAEDELVGNIATEQLLWWCDGKALPLTLDRPAFEHALQLANAVFV